MSDIQAERTRRIFGHSLLLKLDPCIPLAALAVLVIAFVWVAIDRPLSGREAAALSIAFCVAFTAYFASEQARQIDDLDRKSRKLQAAIDEIRPQTE